MAEPSAKSKVEEHNPLDELLAAEKAYVRTYREITRQIARHSKIVYRASRFENVSSRSGARRAMKAAGNELASRMRKEFPARDRDEMISEQIDHGRLASKRMFLAGMSDATGRSTRELRSLARGLRKYEEMEPSDFEEFEEPIEDIVIGAQVQAGLHADTSRAEADFTKRNRALMPDLWDKHAKDMTEATVGDLAQGLAEDAIAAALILLIDKHLQPRIDITTRRGDTIAMNETQVLASDSNAARQVTAGFGQYVWTSQGDDDVRDLHVELDGTVQSWSDGPDDGMHPGQPTMCRCSATPHVNQEIIRFARGAHAEMFKVIQGRRLITRGFPGLDTF